MSLSLEDAAAEVARLSDEAARLHQLIGQRELELDTARDQQSQGVRTAAEWAVSLVKSLADLRARRDENDRALMAAIEARDVARAREGLAEAKAQAKKAPQLRELVTKREAAAERVEAALAELAAAIEEADSVAWEIRKAGGQKLVGDAVGRMLSRRQLQAALWCVKAHGEPLGLRTLTEKPHRPAPFAESDAAFRANLLAAIDRMEAAPAALEAKAKKKEAA